jgi:hypothetical protein
MSLSKPIDNAKPSTNGAGFLDDGNDFGINLRVHPVQVDDRKRFSGNLSTSSA